MYVCANRIVAAATSPEGLLRAGSITEGNQGVDVHNAFKKKPEPALATCDVPGCHRVTWNGKAKQQCCRTCKSSGGSEHGPHCESLWQAQRAGSAPSERLVNQLVRESQGSDCCASWQAALDSREPPRGASRLSRALSEQRRMLARGFRG